MVAEGKPVGPALRLVEGSVVPKVGPDGRQLRACGAVRVSEDKQGQGYSPETQREAILARAHADGYLMDPEDIYEDHARGHKLTRKGYVAILKGVRAARYHAVYVYMLDRWGRDSIERQQRGKEFDKLGVPLISVLEGVDEPGLVRAVRAEMAEEEGRKNARRVMPNRERAAREGTHMGMTPYGYRRVFPEWDGKGRRPAGMLVPHEPQDGSVREADIVRELFTRYATGQWSTRELAADLNARGVPAPKADKGYVWSTATLCRLLANVVYRGDVGYNQRAGLGHYVQTPSSEAFVVEGKHEALVSRDVFAEVQRRLAEARSYQSVARKTPHIHLVAGLLCCAECGGLMVPTTSIRRAGSARHGQMRCADRHEGRSSCTASGYRLDLATEALLAEVSRLRGMPWTLEGERRLSGEEGAVAQALDRALVEARETLTRATRRFMVEIKEPTKEDRDAFEAVRCEMGARIRELEQQQAALQHDAQVLPRLRALHTRLRQTEVADLVGRLRAAGKDVELRDLLTSLVASARLVERVPETRSTWLRLKVTWHPDVKRLRDVGLLTLGPAPFAEKPAESDARTLARRERRKASVDRS